METLNHWSCEEKETRMTPACSNIRLDQTPACSNIRLDPISPFLEPHRLVVAVI